MNSKSENDETMMLEWDRQTQNNLDSLEQYQTLFQEFPGSIQSKLENFARHIRRQTLSKFLARAEIFKNILNVSGSVIELGVSAAQSLMTWAQLSAIYEPVNYTRKIIGFDTFQGIPKISEKDEQPGADGAYYAAQAIFTCNNECKRIHVLVTLQYGTDEPDGPDNKSGQFVFSFERDKEGDDHEMKTSSVEKYKPKDDDEE